MKRATIKSLMHTRIIIMAGSKIVAKAIKCDNVDTEVAAEYIEKIDA
ncbi:MAG: hypothetical protein V2I31_02825 [Mariniphaga sp.]|nr:hypothetical protein [Mariniphaga sp.]